MNLKFTMLFIASFQLSLLEPCHSRPIFSYIFGDEEASTPTDVNDVDDAVAKLDLDENELNLDDAVANKLDLEENEPNLDDAVANKLDFEEEAMGASSEETTTVQPRLGNVGVPAVLKTVALAARTLNHGVRGTKNLVQGSLDLTTKAVGGLRRLGNNAIDGMQGAIDRSFRRTMDKFSQWTKKTNTYRKGLSGTTAKSPDRGHSLTITTSSDAPVKSINEFMSQYLPAGVGDGSIPDITSIDLSKLW